MSYCYLAFRTNVLLNFCCPGHLSYYSPNESETLIIDNKREILQRGLVSLANMIHFSICSCFVFIKSVYDVYVSKLEHAHRSMLACLLHLPVDK